MSRLTYLCVCRCSSASGSYFTRSKASHVLKEFRKLHSYARSLGLSTDRQRDPNLNPIRNHIACTNKRAKCVSASVPLNPLHISKRDFSAETYSKYFSPDVAPIGYAQKVLESIHSTTGLPWWASIAVSTMLLRGIVTLPLAIYSMRIMAKVELLQPEIGKLSQELRREVAVAVKKFAWDTKYARFKYNSTMRKLIKDLYIRENCHPAKSSLVLWFQIPMWVCLSFALRNMSGAVPTASTDIEAPVLCPDLRTEGTLWFPDLTAPDATWILPVLLGLTNLLNIEMHSLTGQKARRMQKIMMNVMRLLSVVMVPIGAVVPSCMCYYWVCSSLFGLGQNVLFKFPSVRRLLRLPRTPSESQTPFTDMYNAAKLKYVLRAKQKDS
ncbi:cytochrome c oxidase assembly protein COX18, mitochondrial-like [Littorina saxatilis]|uniref:cytochrome c oxidase assembly protein COX18, mitochondrial-like n=1 Tax=Littorina saxatilis TaxID=31220 RepID=UPI0038B5D1BB